MKIAIISSVLPVPTIGGELILWRHLTELAARRSETQIYIFYPEDKNMLKGERLVKTVHIKRTGLIADRLSKTRLSTLAHDWIQTGKCISYEDLRLKVGKYNPDVILTVAHGELMMPAAKVADEFKLPLITFYHDWWPDFAPVSRRGRVTLENQFCAIAEQSVVNLCVCTGMLQALETPKNSIVLYPMPGRRVSGIKASAPDETKINVAYSGNLYGAYGRMVYDLSVAVEDNKDINFRFSGNQPDWSVNELNRFQNNYQGCLTPNEYQDFLSENDLLLVTMSFESIDQRRAKTSFPSKLVEYAQMGKPILVWGPEYCSAVQWARGTGAAEVITSNLADRVVNTIIRLALSSEELGALAEQSKFSAMKEFSPEVIQQCFEEVIDRAAHQVTG